MAVLGALLVVGRWVYLDKLSGPNLPRDAAAAFYDILVHYLRLGLRIVAAIALLVAAGAYLSGPSRRAVAIRGWFGSLGDRRRAADSPFGRWVAANKTALRVGAILVPLAILLLWNSPSLTVLIVLLVIAVLLLLAIELLGRAPPAEYGTPTSVT
jgi:hypothetical protein